MNTRNLLSRSLIIVACLLFSATIFSQEDSKSKKWNFHIAPYIQFPNMNGDMTINGVSFDSSASSKDIYDNMDLGTMLYFEANTDQWAIIVDGYYVDLGAEGETPLLQRKTSIDLKQLGISIGGYYRLNSWAEIGLATRINSVTTGFTVAPGDEGILPGQDVSSTETWVDPLIAGRLMTRFNDSKWRLVFTADMGGFGIGSKFAYQLNGIIAYQIAHWFELTASYRLNGFDYEKGSGSEKFAYNTTLYGPSIGVMFNF